MVDHLFKPGSIAVIGASREEKKVGHAVLKNLLLAGYKGKLYPVNPKAQEILGIRTYSSLKEIISPIDQIVVAVPPPLVVETLKNAVEVGVKTAVIITAGFRETGPEGLRLEEELKDIARKGNIRILGPNCLGIINTAIGLNATFAAGTPPQGKLSFFSQSGALGIAILDWAIGNNIGISKFISLGNKIDLTELDFLEYFMNDPETEVILGYIEDVVDGRRFLEIAKRATKIKPVILIKSGGTEHGARAASSHTGALAGSEIAFEAAFKQTGVIRAKTIQELFDLALFFSSKGHRPFETQEKINSYYKREFEGQSPSKRLPEGNRLLIITNAGGPGILAADAAEREGMDLPLLKKESIEELKKGLPGNASLYNPIDIIGDADSKRYRFVLEKVLMDEGFDALLVILTPQAMTDVKEVAEIIVEKAKETSKPIITSLMGEAKTKEASLMLRQEGIPSYTYPEVAISVIRKAVDFYKWKNLHTEEPEELQGILKNKAEEFMNSFIKDKRTDITEADAMDFLSLYGFRFPRRSLAKTAEEAGTIAQSIGFPVVMKISSPEILHKTEVGGVKLNINSREEAHEAFLEITSNVKRLFPHAYIKGVMVYEMIKGGKELIMGITFDRTFGHMVMVGLGGIYVEVLKDVSFRIVPVSRRDAFDMLEELRAFRLLKGVRGERPADIEAIIDQILRLSRLAMDFPEIMELDINPLVVFEKGAICLDARIIISHLNEGGNR